MRRNLPYLILFLVLNACSTDSIDEPETINISALPDRSPEAVRNQHSLLIEHICKKVDVTCQWIDSPDYESLVDRFGKGEIDLAYFGGVTFTFAHERHNAIPLVMRDIDMRFTSSLYVLEDNHTINRLEDLKGQTLSFGPYHSTSGHIMPRYYLGKKGIVPEDFFAFVTHSSGHDSTLARINNKEIEAGIANSYIATDIIREKNLPLKLIWKTPPYADYVWAVHPDMNSHLKSRLLNAFLELSITEPNEKIILENQGARGYLPASIDDFNDVRHAVEYFSSQKQNSPSE